VRVRILLADDHAIVRRGLKQLLEEQAGWTVCGEAANGREAVDKAVQSRPDVAVLDFSMPELNGLEATRRIRQVAPEVEVLVFTMHESEELIREVLAAGARGYVLKSDATRQLVPAVESLARHKPFFSGRVSEVILEGFLKAGSTGRPSPHISQVSRCAGWVRAGGWFRTWPARVPAAVGGLGRLDDGFLGCGIG
jgi:DNA-binding NarL/FixJ family response regulator